ncbi:MAG: S-layer homology domain-containing protein [Actinobacteria bacterium]|nr:S-layer homology domain-containing protein [Actinomycetota bacterium]
MPTTARRRSSASVAAPRWVRRPVLALLVALLAVVWTPVEVDAAARYADEERRFLDLMNNERRATGLDDLVATPAVASVARAWSQTMASDGRLRHNPRVGEQLTVEWSRWGENVGWASNAGGGDLATVTRRLHRGFMDSAGHRANILGRFNQVGVGVAVDRNGTMWATMVFIKGPLDRTASHPSDIAGNSHRAAITAAWERGLIDACDGGRRFCPHRNASRRIVATTVARMLELEPTSGRYFTDVTGTSEINALAEAGIVNGCAPGLFCPGRSVSRAQVAALLVRALDLPAGAGQRFTDLPAGYVHTDAVNALAAAGVTRGCDTRRFCPAGRVTRAQLASFVIRALDR